MGRKPEKGDVHVYAYVNHGAVHLKKQTLQHCKSSIHQYKIQITQRKCRLYSPQALVTGAAVTFLKPGQAWFPRIDCHGADGAGEGVPADEPCPMDLLCLFPSA